MSMISQFLKNYVINWIFEGEQKKHFRGTDLKTHEDCPMEKGLHYFVAFKGMAKGDKFQRTNFIQYMRKIFS